MNMHPDRGLVNNRNGDQMSVQHRRKAPPRLAGFGCGCRLRLWACGLLALWMTGCGGGDSGPPRYDVSGKVTFGGKPVGFGMIYFQADTKAGKDGPQGFATIRDGAFNTRSQGKGSIGGATVVRITGFDAEPPKDRQDGATGPQALFNDYHTSAELPTADAVKDFDVPADAKSGPPLRPTGQDSIYGGP